jgi:hypothetical protein
LPALENPHNPLEALAVLEESGDTLQLSLDNAEHLGDASDVQVLPPS